MRIEQIAIGCKNPKEIMQNLREVLGIKDWINDQVIAKGSVFGENNYSNCADLNFNYELGPFEFELLKYESGINWHSHPKQDGCDGETFLSHLGIHIDDPDEFNRITSNLSKRFEVAQDVTTTSHTNEEIKDKRRYHYVIFDSRKALGFDLKLIQRLNMNGTPYVEPTGFKLINLQDQIISLQDKLAELKEEKANLEMDIRYG